MRATVLLCGLLGMLSLPGCIELDVSYDVPIVLNHGSLRVDWLGRHFAADRDVQARQFPGVYGFAVGLCKKKQRHAFSICSQDKGSGNVQLTVCTRHLSLLVKKGLTCSGSRLVSCPILM